MKFKRESWPLFLCWFHASFEFGAETGRRELGHIKIGVLSHRIENSQRNHRRVSSEYPPRSIGHGPKHLFVGDRGQSGRVSRAVRAERAHIRTILSEHQASYVGTEEAVKVPVAGVVMLETVRAFSRGSGLRAAADQRFVERCWEFELGGLAEWIHRPVQWP